MALTGHATLRAAAACVGRRVASLAERGCSDVLLIERLLTRLEQLRNLSWTRRVATSPHDVDADYHLVSVVAGSMATRCNGLWLAGDTVETSIDGPPLHEMCWECARRWAAGKDIELYALLDLARDLRTEDIANAALHEAARVEMIGGGS